jgi:hypothetical protein
MGMRSFELKALSIKPGVHALVGAVGCRMKLTLTA